MDAHSHNPFLGEDFRSVSTGLNLWATNHPVNWMSVLERTQRTESINLKTDEKARTLPGLRILFAKSLET